MADQNNPPLPPLSANQSAPAVARPRPSPFDRLACEAYIVTMGAAPNSQFCLNCGQAADATHRANHHTCSGVCWRCNQPGAAHRGRVCHLWDNQYSQSWCRRLNVPNSIILKMQKEGILQGIHFSQPQVQPNQQAPSTSASRPPLRASTRGPASTIGRRHGRGSAINGFHSVHHGRIERNRPSDHLERFMPSGYTLSPPQDGYSPAPANYNSPPSLVEQDNLAMGDHAHMAPRQNGPHGVVTMPGPYSVPRGVVATPGPGALTPIDAVTASVVHPAPSAWTHVAESASFQYWHASILRAEDRNTHAQETWARVRGNLPIPLEQLYQVTPRLLEFLSNVHMPPLLPEEVRQINDPARFPNLNPEQSHYLVNMIKDANRQR